MNRRCFDVKFEKYPKYGGAGIRVCDGWRSFVSFQNSLGERPENMTIDRIENKGHYSCGACEQCITNGWPMNGRWATPKAQSLNSSVVKMMTVKGETLCMSDMARKYHIHIMTLSCRKKRGMSDEDAVLTPLDARAKRYKKYELPNPRNS